MKKIATLTAVTATIILALNGCSQAEQAAMEQGMRDAQRTQNTQSTQGVQQKDMLNMERDCKNYVTDKFNLPMAAASVYPGTGGNGRYTIPVYLKWQNPMLDERGTCTVENGIVRAYRAN